MKVKTFIAASSTFLLAACGGGSSGSSATSAHTAAAITLTGTGGDMSKYIGTWKSDCGVIILGSNAGKGQLNVYSITSASGSTATGTLTVGYYTDSSCSTPLNNSLSGTYSITLTYQNNLTVTSDTPPSMEGSADQLTLTFYGQSTSEKYSVGFIGGYSRFYEGATSFFNSAALGYTKSS